MAEQLESNSDLDASDDSEQQPESQYTHRGGPLSIQLPVEFTVLDKARLMTQDRNIRTDELATCISQDPILTLEVLRIANAMFFVQDRPPITTAQTAVVRLGSANVEELIENAYNRPPILDPHVLKEFERLRALARRISIIARIVATSVRKDLAEEAQTVGLMTTMGNMIACAYYGRDYIELAESCKPAALAYKISQTLNFDVRARQLTYLRKHGLPEILLFALDRESQSKAQTRAPLRFIVESAVEMVDAFDNDKFAKYKSHEDLPRQSSIRLLQMHGYQYDNIYEKTLEYLEHTRKEEEEAASFGRIGKETTLIERDNLDLNKEADVDISSLLADQIDALSRLAGGENGNPLDEDNGSSPQDSYAFKSMAIPQTVYIIRDESPEAVTKHWNNQNSKTLVEELCGICHDAESADQLLEQLLGKLIETGPFVRAALMVLTVDRSSAYIHAAVGEELQSGQVIAFHDPLSPVMTTRTSIKSFNSQKSEDLLSPLGITSYAISPLVVDHDTPVVLYADCGTQDSLTFDARRIFRYVVAVVNDTLPMLPGGLPSPEKVAEAQARLILERAESAS